MKKCFKCQKRLPIGNFYRHKLMKDGHLGKCKECTKRDTKKRCEKMSSDPEWIEKERTRNRKKYYRLNYKEKHKPTSEKAREYRKKWRERYPEKCRTKNLSQHMKPKTKGNHLHHWSYNNGHEKDVIELPLAAHYKAHRYMIYDPEQMMYRKLDGILLDTRDSHVAYIKKYIILPF